MALAHICYQCGVDLARVRAVRDPHYHLPLVCCPSCRLHQVRRKHPLSVRWRQVQHLMKATTHGFAVGLILLIIVVYSLLVSGNLIDGFFDLWRDLNTEVRFARTTPVDLLLDALVIGGGLAAAALSGGAFVAGVLHHWKRWLAWLAWLLLLILLGARPIWSTWYREAMHTLYPASRHPAASIDWLALSQSLLGVLVIYIVSFAGVPIGWVGVRIAANSGIAKRKKWRMKRRRQQRS